MGAVERRLVVLYARAVPIGRVRLPSAHLWRVVERRVALGWGAAAGETLA